MSKQFKLAISLLACGLLLLTGCGTPITSLPSELIGQMSENPETINIIAPFSFAASDSDNAAQDEQQWLDEMSKRYGTRFTITHLTWKNGYNTDSDAYIQAEHVLNGEEDFSGLVYVSDFTTLQTAVENDIILPLEDLLSDNPAWNALPDDFKSIFEYQGHIYAIPTSIIHSLDSRYITNDALKQTGINVTDLDSLKNFAVAYTRATGQSALSYYYPSDLGDIMNAFGLYSYNGAYPFGYDPDENCILDFLTKDDAIDALEYLRELYVTGALTMAETSRAPYELFQDGICPTYYDNSEKEDCTRLFTLNPDYPRIVRSNAGGFALTNTTSQPKETVNLFVDMLFDSIQNYLECWLGFPDNYIINSDGTVTVKKVLNTEGDYDYPCLPNLISGLTDIFPFSDSKIFYSEGDKVNTDAAERNIALEDMFQNKTAIKIPFAYFDLNSPSFDATQHDVWELYQKCFKDAITDTDLTVQQIVVQYRFDMYNLGGNQMLDEMNAAIGKTTMYYYG